MGVGVTGAKGIKGIGKDRRKEENDSPSVGLLFPCQTLRISCTDARFELLPTTLSAP